MKLIDADEVRIELTQQLAYFGERANTTSIENENQAYSCCKDGLTLARQIIDNAPTVEIPKTIQQAINFGIFHAENQRPQAEDNQPTGTWIPEEETYTDLSGTIETYTRFKCDRCLQGQNFGPYPFCPWCGKRMNQEIREETKT